MRRIATAAGALLAVLACVAMTSSASGAPRFGVSVNRTVLHGGESLVVHATATTRCTWLTEWDGVRHHVVGRTFTTTYVAPVVARRTTLVLRATCFYQAARTRRHVRHQGAAARAGSDPQTIAVQVPPSWVRTIPVTVLPGSGVVSPPHGNGGNGGVGPGGLPNTGGPRGWLLLAGALCVVTGATAIRRAARDEGMPA
ncbi:MAG: hypothetical protein ACJ72E_07240 [Marmoricola sp.]